MVNLSKYPIRDSCRYRNIFEQLATGRVQSVTMETYHYFRDVWTIGIDFKEIDGEMHLIPFISYKNEHYPMCRFRYYLGIKNANHCTTTVVLPSEWQAHGLGLKFLDLKPELLDDGALVVEYGIQVEAFQDVNNIWNFQLRYDSFDSKGKQVMIPFRENGWRCHPQIKAIHDKSIKAKWVYTDFYIPLQIAHGVRYQGFIGILHRIAHDAHAMGLRNVVHYCQWQLIQNPVFDPYHFKYNKIESAVYFDMRSYLVHLLRKYKTKNKLMDILEGLDMKKMSGESMKTFMKFILYE